MPKKKKLVVCDQCIQSSSNKLISAAFFHALRIFGVKKVVGCYVHSFVCSYMNGIIQDRRRRRHRRSGGIVNNKVEIIIEQIELFFGEYIIIKREKNFDNNNFVAI